MARFGLTSIGSAEYSVHSASSHTTPNHVAPRVPLLQRRITNPLFDQTPVPGSALHPHPQGTSTYNLLLSLSGLPSVVFQQVHNILADVPPENIIAMFQAARAAV